MVVTDYHKERTMENVQKEGTMKFLTRWFCCTSKRSCESRSCDRISTYRSRKKEKCGPSAQEHNIYAQQLDFDKKPDYQLLHSVLMWCLEIETNPPVDVPPSVHIPVGAERMPVVGRWV